MQLFIYDEKHEQVPGAIDLGNLTQHEEAIVQKIIAFLDSKQITDRYKRLILANRYRLSFDSGDVESRIIFYD